MLKVFRFFLSLCLVIAISAVFNFSSVTAHQSGCHRWHSCPSDSGSYTCGDTGYSSYCDDSSTYSPSISVSRDYKAEGENSGSDHAVRDTEIIKSSAQLSASSDGTADGRSGALKVAKPSPDATCRKTFTFETTQEALYIAGYESGYETKCAELFRTAYDSVYQTTYLKAAAAKRTEDIKKESDENTLWGWLAVGGAGILAVRRLSRNSK